MNACVIAKTVCDVLDCPVGAYLDLTHSEILTSLEYYSVQLRFKVLIENGKLVLKRRPSKTQPKDLDKLDQSIRKRLPEISIIDLLVETVKWLPIHRYFGPLSGHQGKLSSADKRLVASLFCYGCNLSSTQTARCIEGLSRRQIAYLNLSNVTE